MLGQGTAPVDPLVSDEMRAEHEEAACSHLQTLFSDFFIS